MDYISKRSRPLKKPSGPKEVNSSIKNPVIIHETQESIDTVVMSIQREIPIGETGKRIDHIKKVSNAYATEYRLRHLHTLLLQRIPLDEIATELGVCTNQILNDRKELYRRFKNSSENLDISRIIGDTLGFYAEIQAFSLKTVSNIELPISHRLSAAKTALASRSDLTRFLDISGILDVLQYKAANDVGQQDMQQLIDMTKELLGSKEDKSVTISPDGTVEKQEPLDDELIQVF